MSDAQEIETWVAAVQQYDNQEFEEALRTFDNIADTAKILFNSGVIHATLGQHSKAVSAVRRRMIASADLDRFRLNASSELS